MRSGVNLDIYAFIKPIYEYLSRNSINFDVFWEKIQDLEMDNYYKVRALTMSIKFSSINNRQ